MTTAIKNVSLSVAFASLIQFVVPVFAQGTAGIGVVLAKERESFVVKQIVPESPAAQSQAIQAGDVILEIGQGDAPAVSVQGMEMQEVVLITASVDENPETAERHLKRKGWDQAHHVWVEAEAIRAYRVNMLPTTYIIDQEGSVVAAGHTLDVPEIVNGLLGEPPLPDSEQDLEQALSAVDQRIRGCLEVHDYHGAIRLLPSEAALWEKLMEKTGKGYEGAHGFLHGLVMSRTAAFGDSQWGKVLDDIEIPHRYKTELVSWVLEERLGKGSVYWGNEANLIIPIPRRLDFEREERLRLPEGISTQNRTSRANEDLYREIIEAKHGTPLARFEVISFSPTTKVLWYDWEREWWGWFNVIETKETGEPLFWYDIPQPPTAQSIERIRVVTFAGKKFLEVIDCTHMGNGGLYLYEIRGGFLRRKLSARVIANLSVRFDPRIARIEYRESDGGHATVIVQADCIDQGWDGSEEKPVGTYYREFVFEGGAFRELRDKRKGREELMD